jgi:excisionase family DNA binding protein
MLESEKKVLTITEVAQMLRIPLSSAKKLASQTGVSFPKSFKVGRHRRWRLEGVEDFMNGNESAKA